MPSFATERRDPVGESQLESLLGELLDKETSAHSPGVEAPREIVELRDAARRLRAASQWMPLPEGRLAVRRALLATADQSRQYAGRASWRRAGLWLSMAAVAAVVVGAFGLGAGVLNALVPPGSPMYSLRLVLDQARGVFVPGHPNPGQYALSYQFPAVQLPAAGGVTRTANGTIGGLPTTLTLTATDGCGTGGPCGRFVVSLAGLSTPASAKFGELKGTFACAPDGCTLALAKATGVFAQVNTPHMSVRAARVSEGRLMVKMASRGEWVAAVAMAAYALQTDGMLPVGLTVQDLVGKAAGNDQKSRNGGGPNGRLEENAPNSAGAQSGGKGASSGSGSGTGTSESGNTGTGGGTSNGTGAAGGVSIGGDAGPNGVGGGINGNGSAPTNDGVTVGGGATVNDASTGTSGVGVSGGASVGAGASTGTGGAGVSGGASVDAGASTGTGGVGVSGGASVDAGASTGTGGAGVSGGASVDAGTSTGSSGAGVNAGAGGIGVGGGVNVNSGVNAPGGLGGLGGLSGSGSGGGGSGGGGSGGSGGRDAGTGSH